MRPEWFVEQEPEKPPEVSTPDYSSLKAAEPVEPPERSRPEWSTPEASKRQYYSDAVGILNELPSLQENKGFEGVKQTLEKLDPQQRDTELSKIQTSMWLADRFEMKPSTVYRNFETISREFWGEVTQPQSAFNSIKQSWILGKKETELGHLRYRQMMGENVSEEIEKLKKSMPSEDQKKRMLPVGMAKSMMRMLPTMLSGIEEGAQRGIALGTAAAGTAATLGQVGPQALVLEEAMTIPGAFALMFGVGSISGSMENIGQIEAGLAYDELLEMGVSDGIAKAASAGVGAINAALEMVQIKKIPGMDALISKALGKTITSAFKNGSIGGIAKTAMKKYGANVSEQVLQEVMQESTNVMAGEFAKQLNNIYKGSDIPYSEIKEITSRLKETAIESAKGFALMGIPGTVAQTVASSKAGSARNISEVDLEGQLWDRLANAEGKELDELVEAINEQTGENQKSETKIDIEPGVAKVKSGEKEVQVDYSVDDDVLTIDNFGDLNAYEAREVLATMQNQYPDRVMQFAEDIENIEQLKRGIEDLDPKVRAVNMQMDKVSGTLEGLQTELQETQGEMQQKKTELSQAKESKAPQEEISSIEMEVESFQSQIEEIGFSIESMSDTFDSLRQTKDTYNPLEYRESWSMTSGEYRRNLQARNVQESNITTSTLGTSLKSEIKNNIPNLTEEQTDASVRLVEAMARAKGMDVNEYVNDTFRFATEQEKQNVQQKAKAKGIGWSGAHQIGEDGRSIIAASESADFSTFIHELGHVLRRTLTPEEEAVVAKWAGAVENEDGTYTWTEYAEESFADGFTEYLRSGKAPNQELENIFRKISNFLKEIANRVFQDIQLSPEVEDVFSELLGAGREYAQTQEEQVLFQKEMDKVADKNLVTYHNVSSDMLNEINKLGGMPMPSLAITKKDIPFTQFGDTTLIGTRELFSEAYDRDIWSPTVPRPEYKINDNKLYKIDSVFAKGQKYTDTGYIIQNLSQDEYSTPDRAVERLKRSYSTKAAYLIEQGKEVPYIERNPKSPIEEVQITDEMVDLYKNIEESIEKNVEEVENPNYDPNSKKTGLLYKSPVLYNIYDSEGIQTGQEYNERQAKSIARQEAIDHYNIQKQLSEVAWKEIEEYLRSKLSDRPDLVEELVGEGPAGYQRYFDSDGELKGMWYNQLEEQVLKVLSGKQEPDYKAMENWIDQQVQEEEFVSWLYEKLEPAYSGPYVKIGRQYLNYSAENILESMQSQSKQGSQETMFAPSIGKIASIAGNVFHNIEEMKEAAGELKTKEEVKEITDNIGKRDEELRDRAVEFYKWDDAFEAFTDYRKAVFDYVKKGYKRKSPDRMRKMMNKYDFSPSEDFINDTLDLLEDAIAIPTDYFEAKPDRVVSLREFQAAVIPTDAEPIAKEVAAENNLEIVEYDKAIEGDRLNKTEEYLNRNPDVLFQPAPPTNSQAFKEWFGDSKIVDENGSPKVVYHSTDSQFQEFSLEKLGENTALNTDDESFNKVSQLGFWFNDADLRQSMGVQNKIEAYLSVENPLIVEDLSTIVELVNEYETADDFVLSLNTQGYDGILIKNDEEFNTGASYVAFDPTQIKSVNNRGTFDPNNPNILFQKATKEEVNRIQNDIKDFLEEEDQFSDESWEFRIGLHQEEGETRQQTKDRLIREEQELKESVEKLSPYGTVFENENGDKKLFHNSTKPGEVFRITQFTNDRPDYHIPLGNYGHGYDGIISEVSSAVSDGYKPTYSFGPTFLEINTNKDHSRIIKNDDVLFQVGPVYHGTPHSFDRFTTEKIGTGEGAQAFGWGLYFTDKEAIAKHYAGMKAPILSSLTEKVQHIEVGEKNFTDYDLIVQSDFVELVQEGNKQEINSYVNDQMWKWSDLSKDKEYPFQNYAKQQHEGWMQLSKDLESKSIKYHLNRNLYTATLHKGKDLSEYTWIDWDEKTPQTKIDKIQSQNKKEELALDEKGWPTKLDIKKGESGSSIYNEIKRAFGNTVDAPKQASMFLLRAGIDGIRYPAGTLSGGGKGTNYVVFDENAVTVEDHILFQRSPEHEAEVQRAVEMGLPVPSNVLREYSDKQWAVEELSRRESVLQKLTDFNWLARDAREYDNAQEFIEYVQSDFFEFTAKEDHPEFYTEGEQVSNQWLEEFWKDVQEQDSFMETTLEEGNKRWLSQVDDNYIKEAVRQIAEKYAGQKGKSLSIHGKFYAAAAKIKNGKGFEQKDIDTMKKVVENNPTRYREVLSIILDDQEEWQRLRVQEYGDLAAGKQTPEEKIQPKSRMDLAKEIEQLNKEKVQSGSYTAGEVDDLYTQVSKQLKAADRKINTLERELKEEKGSSTVQVEKGRQKNEQMKAQITDLEKSIKSYDKKLDKLSEKDQAQRETIDSARREARLQLKDLQEEYKEFVQSAQKEARKGAEEATKSERARQKELQKKKREAKQLREYKEKLARVIRRQVPKSVHWEYREMIESIQAGIDPHFRSKRTRIVWDKRKEYFARNPEMLNELSPDFSQKLWKQSLDEFKLYELEEVADQINHLTQLGKTKLRIIREQRQYEAQKTAQSIASNLLSGEPPAKPEPIVEEKEGVGEKGQALYLSTIRPSRLADMVDGGADFKGLAHKVFIDDVNEAYAQALRDRYAREEKVKAKMETLGITFNDLTEQVEIDGVKLSKDQILDIAAAYQNRLKWRAVIHGNNIPVQTALRAINSLTEAEMEFVDTIIGDYEENYNRLRKAHLDYTNEDMGSEENYTPMIRTEQDYTTHKEQIASEILSRKGLRQGTPERGMTKHRIEIANRHQRPIKLGLYETWSAQVPRQEHYIASADQILKMNRIMRNDYFKAAVDQQIGRPMYKELQSYIDRFANPNIYKSFGTWDKAIKKVRNNVALAYLAFNMMTMIKQVPSLAFYMAEAGPGDLLAGFSKATTNWKETRKFIEDRDPQMRERAIERDMEELKRMKAKGYQKIQKKIGDTGMKGILFFDKLATTSGWIATYDKYKRKGYSEAEAVKAARDVTLRTQPQASAKDIASLWAQDGPLTLFTQFSNQLNQIWNMATYDMPAAIRQKNYEKAFGMTAGMVMSGAVIWMLSNRRPPEDLEDWAEIMAEQGMNMVPILGPVAARAMDGWTTDVSVFAPAQGVGELAGLMKKLATGEDVSEYTINSTVRSALEGTAIATGMPFVTPNRAIRGLGDDAVVQYILFGGKLKGSKEE